MPKGPQYAVVNAHIACNFVVHSSSPLPPLKVCALGHSPLTSGQLYLALIFSTLSWSSETFMPSSSKEQITSSLDRPSGSSIKLKNAFKKISLFNLSIPTSFQSMRLGAGRILLAVTGLAVEKCSPSVVPPPLLRWGSRCQHPDSRRATTPQRK